MSKLKPLSAKQVLDEIFAGSDSEFSIQKSRVLEQTQHKMLTVVPQMTKVAMSNLMPLVLIHNLQLQPVEVWPEKQGGVVVLKANKCVVDGVNFQVAYHLYIVVHQQKFWGYAINSFTVMGVWNEHP